jgi:hypothetical protein
VLQAVQLACLTFLPSIYLSGLLCPIEGMPRGARYLAAVIPLTYYLKVVRGIARKGVGWSTCGRTCCHSRCSAWPCSRWLSCASGSS